MLLSSLVSNSTERKLLLEAVKEFQEGKYPGITAENF
jgi:hypothetical protein